MNRVNVKQSGNWSDSNTWPYGILPVSGDKVYTNGCYVVIDTDIDVDVLTNERTYEDASGGGFTALSGVTIKANMYNATEPLLKYQESGSIMIIGNIEGGRYSLEPCIENLSTGTIHISGNVRGGWGAYVPGVKNLSTGTVDLTGNATMGLGGGSNAICNQQEGTIIINNIVNTSNNCYGGDSYIGEEPFIQ
jgi:hypothetical protein